jgi:cell division protein FtsI (penicillin-binding protein 3)
MKPVVMKKNICSNGTLKACRKMMEGVMEKGGTADDVFKSSPYKVAGKTGTAWINEGGSYQLNRYRASFVGYFPANDPRYSCIVIVHDPRSGIYYGSAVAAPVFKELADKIYSTQIEFHEDDVVADSTALAGARIPVAKNGSGKSLHAVYRALHIPAEGTRHSEWVSTQSARDTVLLTERAIKPGLVPNVVGMGLSDAIYILENNGMNVRAIGSGTVKRQSVQPGSSARTNSYITIELL